MEEEGTLTFEPNLGVFCRAIIFVFSIYAAIYLLSSRKSTIIRKKNTLQDFHISIDSSSSGGDSPRSCSTLSPDPKSESTVNQWHPKRSSPSNKAVRLSCVPFTGPRARMKAGIAIDRMRYVVWSLSFLTVVTLNILSSLCYIITFYE